MIRELPPLKSLSGHDAYCHVCWLPTFRFWIVPEAPDYTRCGIGDFDAQSCPNSRADTNFKKMVADLKQQGLWPSRRPSPKDNT